LLLDELLDAGVEVEGAHSSGVCRRLPQGTVSVARSESDREKGVQG
jgi:hypothetical protein